MGHNLLFLFPKTSPIHLRLFRNKPLNPNTRSSLETFEAFDVKTRQYREKLDLELIFFFFSFRSLSPWKAHLVIFNFHSLFLMIPKIVS